MTTQKKLTRKDVSAYAIAYTDTNEELKRLRAKMREFIPQEVRNAEKNLEKKNKDLKKILISQGEGLYNGINLAITSTHVEYDRISLSVTGAPKKPVEEEILSIKLL